MNKVLFLRMKRDDIAFTFVTTLPALSYPDMAADKIALILIPFDDKLFEIVGGHERVSLSIKNALSACLPIGLRRSSMRGNVDSTEMRTDSPPAARTQAVTPGL